MSAYRRWIHLTEKATEMAATWTLKEKAIFHYFNPNGLHAQKKAMDDKVRTLVHAGKANSGAFFVYGSLNRHHRDRLDEMANGDKRIDRFALTVTLQGLRMELERTAAWIQEVEEEHAAKEAQEKEAQASARYRQDTEALTAYVADLQDFLKSLPEAGREHDGHRFRLMECVDALREAGQITE